MTRASESVHSYWRKKQDEAFERNAVLRQKLFGVIICLLGIVFQLLSGSIWWAGITATIMFAGLYFIFSERR